MVSVVPLATPFSTAHTPPGQHTGRGAVRVRLRPRRTSAKGNSPSISGLPAARHRKNTASSRVHTAWGAKVPIPHILLCSPLDGSVVGAGIRHIHELLFCQRGFRLAGRPP